MRVLAATVLVACAAAQEPVIVPAFTAYSSPDPGGMQRPADGSVPRWRGALDWHGFVTRAGELRVALRLLPGAPATRLRLQVGDDLRQVDVAADAPRIAFDPVAVATGYVTLRLTAAQGAGPGVAALELAGSAAKDARFPDVERRNCASVHLGYDLPDDLRRGAAWFYCECTPRTDPLWTYYMATGWRRGYFGMQVNSERERRVIFSVWDSGTEAVDRDKVAAEDRVELLAKGDRVHADGFGNEGTGGHSHVVQDWQLGDTFCFLVHAEPRDSHTTYTGWYATRPGGEWQLVASFRAPKDGGLLRGLYSFDENFGGANGDLRRECEFGNQWVRGPDGPWRRLVTARFTHDGHGRALRLDRFGSVRDDRFVLTTGGFEPAPGGAVTDGGGRLERAPGEGAPPGELPVPISR